MLTITKSAKPEMGEGFDPATTKQIVGRIKDPESGGIENEKNTVRDKHASG